MIHLAALRAATASSTSPLAPRYPELGERWAFTELRANYPDVLVTDYAKLSSVGQAFLVHTLCPDCGSAGMIRFISGLPQVASNG